MSSQYTFKSSGRKTRPDRVKPIPSPSTSANPPSRSRSSSQSSITSFTSAVSNHDHQDDKPTRPASPPPRFPPAQETLMLQHSNALKQSANRQFGAKDYSSAISTYDKALAELPVYLDYEMAVLQSNIAACHLQLREWRDAVECCERGLEGLEREMPMPKAKKENQKTGDAGTEAQEETVVGDDDGDGKVVELPDDQDDQGTAEALKKLDLSDQRKADVLRIRTKLLLRRARAKVMLCDNPSPPSPPSAVSNGGDTTTSLNGHSNPTTTTATDEFSSPPSKSNNMRKEASAFENGSHWSNLSTALADYQTLATPEYFRSLPQSDQKTVIQMLHELPPRVEAAKKREVDEMMGKLKELGNGILKPFGLSTDMFKMTQDPNTGGWSMGFDQGKK